MATDTNAPPRYGPGTYRPDRYYLNTMVGGVSWHRCERTVPAWRWWLNYLLCPWRWQRSRQGHVLYERA